MPDEAPVVFTRFVSSVEGRLVSRWDAPGACFGARLATFEERKAGAAPFTWDTECVVPLMGAFCAKYDRELRNALRGGDLKECSREDYEQWLKTEAAREAEHVARLNAAKAEAEKPAAEASVETHVQAEDTTPPDEAEPKGRKKK